jgi:hypothetical protein
MTEHDSPLISQGEEMWAQANEYARTATMPADMAEVQDAWLTGYTLGHERASQEAQALLLGIALAPYQPLIEAARAYRDAKAAFDMAGPPSAVHATGEELLDARDELCEAARTFEVSHEEQG